MDGAKLCLPVLRPSSGIRPNSIPTAGYRSRPGRVRESAPVPPRLLWPPTIIPNLSVPGDRVDGTAKEHTAATTEFALGHEADAIGIAAMDHLYVFEGYEIEESWVIILAPAHNYERLKQVLPDETNGVGVADVGEQYARGTRASYGKLRRNLNSFPIAARA
jgi:hypothetical protein